jgi:hypothetical protein
VDDVSTKPPAYFGDDENGPLTKACNIVFKWAKPDNLIIVIWHEGWSTKPEYFTLLRDAVCAKTKPFQVLITFFGNNLLEYRERPGGHLLPLLFRLLNMDPEYPKGCCPITDFNQLGNAVVEIDPSDHEVRLSQKANEMLGLIQAPASSITPES